MQRFRLPLLALVTLTLFSAPAFATNGMNLEGYGPIATGMGGASFAYDNGAAAAMNNPATLALMSPGRRLDVALGFLGPDVSAVLHTPQDLMTAESSSNAFLMPAIGYVMKQNRLGLGLCVFGQGGMGIEYGADSWMADPSQGANTALQAGLVNRSEVSVGRAILPVTYDVTPQLSVGGSFDFVWAGMDLQMAMSESQFQDLANPGAQTMGSASGTLVGAFGQMYEPFGGHGIQRLYHAYFDFSNDNGFTGQARGYGVAGKLGVVYRPCSKITAGAAFQSKTTLGDLETSDAMLGMGVRVDPGIFQGAPTGQYTDMILPVSGSITVKNFEWPAIYGAGIAYRPQPNLMLTADVKRIAWAGAMKNFTMVFHADDTQENGGFADLEMESTLLQKWEDQTVIAVGGSFRPTRPLTLRAGFNYASNPIPDTYLNALFPAIVESHVTLGGSFAVAAHSTVHGSLVYAPEASATNPGNGTTVPAVESTHSQLNWQVMFSQRF